MKLYTDTLIERLRDMPGARHSFLRQICVPEGGSGDAAVVRSTLEGRVQALPPPLAESIGPRLCSLENRRFFQAFSELMACQLILGAQGNLRNAPAEAGLIQANLPGGPLNLLVMGYIHSHGPETDRGAVRELAQSLARVRTERRFAVFVRRWMPPRFNTTPIRQAVDLWLRDIQSGAWQGRYAAYEDDGVLIEFGLTGEKIKAGQNPVAFVCGPFMAGRVIQVLEQRVVRALDTYRLGPHAETPVLVLAVADQPWTLSSGYVRELILGRPVRMMSQAGLPMESVFGADREPCLFRDVHYPMLAGMGLLGRPVGQPLTLTGEVYLNPFSSHPLQGLPLPFRAFAACRWEGEAPCMRWIPPVTAGLTLGAI